MKLQERSAAERRRYLVQADVNRAAGYAGGMRNSTSVVLGFTRLSSGLFAAEPRFKAVEIDKAIEIGYGIAAADVNGDKKPDLVLADKAKIVWYENPSWKKHVIAEKLTQ